MKEARSISRPLATVVRMTDRLAPVAMLLLVIWSLPAAATATTPDPTPTPARIAYPGGLDRTFGVGGNAAPPAGLMPVWAAVAVQADGKSVVVGNAADAVVARYDTNGILDENFGSNGIVTPAPLHGGRVDAVAVTKDGDIVVAGVTEHGTPSDPAVNVAVIRLTGVGTLDPTFGTGGVATVDMGIAAEAPSMILPADGGIVVLAGSQRAHDNGTVTLLGFRHDGSLDPRFGEAGMVQITGAALEEIDPSGMVEEPDGRFVVAVSSFTRFRLRVMRFDRSGHLARTFEELSGSAAGIARLANGEIVVSGAANTPDSPVLVSPALLRFTSSGALDRSFGDHGVLASNEGIPGTIVIDDRNRILVVADVLTRHNSDGVLDTDFGIDGVAANSDSAVYHGVAVQPDGKIVAAGGACFLNPETGGDCLTSLARYESDRTQLCGDADADGVFSVTDGVAALRGAAGFADGCGPLVCDVDGSGDVTVTDGINVLRAAAGLSATLGCGIP